MIPYKNFFSGALGKTKHPGGSPFLTTPHTRLLQEPDYSIEMGVTGEFVCCTLNGRLWLYKTLEGQYSLVALKWNETEGKLELAASQYLSDMGVPIARGIDWILLSYSMIQVVDDAPYILTLDLISRPKSSGIGKNTRFCYSLLRSQMLNETVNGMTVGPGLDPFTRKAWGLLDDTSVNGNLDGWGYFTTNLGGVGLYPAGEHIMEACYSTLPSIGDWNIVEDFLIRRPSAPLDTENEDYHFFMKQVRPLIPLEFNRYSNEASYPAYGTGYDVDRRGIQVAACNGQLWGRGLINLGRAFILPAAFNGEGEPEEFYLYIRASGCKGPYNPMLNPQLDGNDSWLTVAAAALRDATNSVQSQVVGFASEKGNPLNCSVCQAASSASVLVNNAWVNPRPDDESKAAFDAMNGTGLVLGRTGVTFLAGDAANKAAATGDEYSCQGMSELLAPAGQLEGIGQDSVLASFDNALLMTNIPTGFDRLLLPKRTLPLAWGTFETKNAATGEVSGRTRLSLGEETYQNPASRNAKRITVNEIACPDGVAAPVENISWEDVYRPSVDIRVLGKIDGSVYDVWDRLPVIVLDHGGTYGYGQYGYGLISASLYNKSGSVYDPNWNGRYRWPLQYRYHLIYINPETGELIPQTVEIDLTEYYDHPEDPGETMEGTTLVDCWFEDRREEGVGWLIRTYEGFDLLSRLFPTPTAKQEFFIPEPSVPSWLTEPDAWYGWDLDGDMWGRYREPRLELRRKFFFSPDIVSSEIKQGNITFSNQLPCSPYLVFTESSTRTKFLLRSTEFGSVTSKGKLQGTLADIYNSKNQCAIFDFSQTMGVTSYCKSPARDYAGNTKYARSLYVVQLDSLANTRTEDGQYSGSFYWDNPCVYVLRADTNPDVFDFDAELKGGDEVEQNQVEVQE